ncbi:hypothetical protein NP493_1524g00009 [Ridgeia piscesae]|uniref:Uncharacterized protein n=1 Tax=Ridgeia piscesae TaxID=27915 RepID=A0AAD9K0H1_RIDPI|nr:hypothetical protein NP493_1524g00009 [Ridgeia piscesae]
MIRASTARLYNLLITPASQITRTELINWTLLARYIATSPEEARNPFLARNDVAVRSSKEQIIIGDADIIYYGTDECKAGVPSVRRTQIFLLLHPRKTDILSGDYLELHTPCDVNTDTLWALQPQLDSRTNMRAWPPPQDILSVNGALLAANDTDAPILVHSGEHICLSPRRLLKSNTTLFIE